MEQAHPSYPHLFVKKFSKLSWKFRQII
jgi:hypothetical protein